MVEEAARIFEVDKEKSPDGLARFEKVKLSPGEGLVGITEEKEIKIRHVGNLAVEIAQEAGLITEVPLPTEIELLQARNLELEQQLVIEREQHAAEIGQLKEQHAAEMEALRRDLQAYTDNKIEELRGTFKSLASELADRSIISREAADEIEQGLEQAGGRAGEAKPPRPRPVFQPEPPESSPERETERVKALPEDIPEAGDKGGVWDGDKLNGEYEIIEVDRDEENNIKGLWVVREGELKSREHAHYVSPQAWWPFTRRADSETKVESTVLRNPRRPAVTEEEITEYPSPPPERRGGALSAIAAGIGVVALAIGITGLFEPEGAKPKNYGAKLAQLNRKDARLQRQVNSLKRAENKDEKSIFTIKTALKNTKVRLATLERRERFKPAVFASTSTGEYPWNYYAGVYGPDSAETEIQILGRRARAAGHIVRWSYGGYLPSGQRSQIISIDGRTDTGYVVGVLNRYR